VEPQTQGPHSPRAGWTLVAHRRFRSEHVLGRSQGGVVWRGVGWCGASEARGEPAHMRAIRSPRKAWEPAQSKLR